MNSKPNGISVIQNVYRGAYVTYGQSLTYIVASTPKSQLYGDD